MCSSDLDVLVCGCGKNQSRLPPGEFLLPCGRELSLIHIGAEGLDLPQAHVREEWASPETMPQPASPADYDAVGRAYLDSRYTCLLDTSYVSVFLVKGADLSSRKVRNPQLKLGYAALKVQPDVYKRQVSNRTIRLTACPISL